MGQLRDRMDADLRLAGYSDSTRKTYLERAKAFATHYMCSPRDLGETEIRDYLLHMVETKHISRSTYSQIRAALVPVHRHAAPPHRGVQRAGPAQASRSARSVEHCRGRGAAAVHPQPQVRRHHHGPVRQRPAHLRGVPAVPRGHRLASNARPRAGGQGRPGSLHAPRELLTRLLAYLLAHRATAECVAVSGPDQSRTRIARHCAACLPPGGGVCRRFRRQRSTPT
jgi:hypothetical protein